MIGVGLSRNVGPNSITTGYATMEAGWRESGAGGFHRLNKADTLGLDPEAADIAWIYAESSEAMFRLGK
jgi:hypothetical protein